LAELRKLFEPILKAGQAISEMLAHLLVLTAVLGCLKLGEMAQHHLAPDDPIVFGCTTWRQAFHFADMFVLVGILGMGVYKVIRAYR